VGRRKKEKPAAAEEASPLVETAVAVPPATPPPELAPLPNQPPRDIVAGWFLDGQRTNDVREAIRAYWPDLDEAQTVELLTAATEGFRREAELCDVEIVVGFALTSTRDLYRRLVDVGDFATALRALESLTKLARSWTAERDCCEPSPVPETECLPEQSKA
jgi:hypothetical protein